METERVALELGLSAEEFSRIVQLLGRTPNFTELSMFAAMWSEHCSYKNSLVWLRTLPRESDSLLAKAGEENAGLIDIGDGWACAFKIESHNHPSAIEPYQGAATGVGGIHRDIFTMGARPIAALNSLRFGPLHERKSRFLLRGVVKGIGDYGNAFGVPTVGGETFFDDSYLHNPLVNAMSVGIVRHGKNVRAAAQGPGNPVLLVGNATGRDGIHGAKFASQNIGEDSHEDLPSVQVGDPFTQKKLLEATLEAVATGAVVGMQDLGAAGLTSSTSEMCARGGVGMEIHLDRVPLRQTGMQPWEILLSESQERMLLVVTLGREQEIQDIYSKWDLRCAQIGTVREGDRICYYMHGNVVADLPTSSLVAGKGAPVYERPVEPAKYVHKQHAFSLDLLPEPEDLRSVAFRLIGQPNIASKRWIFEQYDSMVGIAHTTINAPCEVPVLRLPDSPRGLAVTVDGNARYVYSHPYTGALIAVAEAARNIICAGATPLAITNCLNFGNPYDPEVYWQFVETVKGMGDACRKLGLPVTGGNVSFYNQSEKGAILPTPVIGMIGVLDNVADSMTLDFRAAGDKIYLIGESHNDLACSEYVMGICGVRYSPPPLFNWDEELAVQQAVHKLIRQDLIVSAHDVSDGGLFTALLECAMPGNLGFDISLDGSFRTDAFLFGESQSRVVVSVRSERENAFLDFLLHLGVEFSRLGEVTDGMLFVDGSEWGHVSEWKLEYDSALERQLADPVTAP